MRVNAGAIPRGDAAPAVAPDASVPARAALKRATLAASALLAATVAVAAPASSSALPSSVILQELQRLRRTGTVLYVAAHPDDENTRLIAWLARGRGYRTGYLSITRGDGGQNLIGPELREALGVIRTQELLAARAIDGGEQFFTRAVDFGYSKSAEETLQIWDRDDVLCDIVRVIRTFRPDVIVTRFPPRGGGTHGHHTASAMLAVEAFKLAADPAAFADELAGLPPWQAKRIVWNAFHWGRRGNEPLPDGAVRVDVGGYNPLLGESYSEIAARSRSMHKSQGFGMVATRGPAMEEFHLLAGEPMTGDLMDGVDTTWARVPGGKEIAARIDDVIAGFDPLQPVHSVPALLRILQRLRQLPSDDVTTIKIRDLERIVQACLGLYVETTIPRATATPGEPLTLEHAVIVRADPGVPVRWVEVRYDATGTTLETDAMLDVNQPSTRRNHVRLPDTLPLTQPYWLREPDTTGMFRVADPALIGRAENPPVFPVTHLIAVGDVVIEVDDEPVQVIDDPVRGEVRHPLEIVPPATVTTDELMLFPLGATREVTVTVTTREPGAAGTIALEAPAGWKVAPAQQAFELGSGETRRGVRFAVTAPEQPDDASLLASAVVGGVRCTTRSIAIHYDHIPPQRLQPEARVQAVSLPIDVRAKSIGYLHGAGDLVPAGLERLGCEVTLLDIADLTPERLRAFDAVVLGVRAFNTRESLASRLPALFAYAEAGGTVVVQYNTTGELKTDRLAPYPLELSRDRVTDERSPVRLLAPDHPALTTPNRIDASDFAGWVQERGLYFPAEWDERFTPLLGLQDSGEEEKRGALLVARHGKGWYVYTSLSFFRELPAGVPGAYRLLANLVSLGQ